MVAFPIFLWLAIGLEFHLDVKSNAIRHDWHLMSILCCYCPWAGRPLPRGIEMVWLLCQSLHKQWNGDQECVQIASKLHVRVFPSTHHTFFAEMFNNTCVTGHGVSYCKPIIQTLSFTAQSMPLFGEPSRLQRSKWWSIVSVDSPC